MHLLLLSLTVGRGLLAFLLQHPRKQKQQTVPHIFFVPPLLLERPADVVGGWIGMIGTS